MGEWISVELRNPDHYGLVLASDGVVVFIARHIQAGDWVNDEGDPETGKVEYWMDFPSPPKK